MSTTFTTPLTAAELGGFDTPDVPKLPTLAAVGFVSEVGDAKKTKNGEGLLSYIPIKIEGVKGSRGQTFNLFFIEQFFTPGFKASSLAGQATDDDPNAGDKLVRRYTQTIVAPTSRPTVVEEKNRVAILEGLCGSQEALNNFITLRNETYLALHPQGGDFTIDEIRDLLNKFLMQENAGQRIGYTLKQRQDKIEGGGENGKDAYVRADGYELDSLFIYDDPSGQDKSSRVYQIVQRAKKSHGDFKVTFELD